MVRQRAFTLVELLVTIAIIVLLIAILLPSLGRAREQAKLVKCAANLRGIYQACANYAGANDGLVPEANNGFHMNGYMAGSGYANLGYAEALVIDGDISHGFKARGGSAPYGHTPALTGENGVNIFICPNTDPALQYDHNAPEYNGYGISYWAGSHFQNGNMTSGVPDGAMPNNTELDPKSVRLRKLNLLNTNKIFGSDGYYSYAGQVGGTWGYWVYQRHFGVRLTKGSYAGNGTDYKGGANYVFCDGHVEWNDKYFLQYPNKIRVSGESYSAAEERSPWGATISPP
jgi:prepilin-type N-terminal cleavage/methylation domain-containing protein/prepilin-type processing-associated H-X9-DG protein